MIRSTQLLIDKHIAPAAQPAEARLRRPGVSVWALVGYLAAVGGDRDRVGHDYELSPDELEAALSYYQEHKATIDARLLLNAV